jgi:hypothetical protein
MEKLNAYEKKIKNKNDYMREYMRKRNQKLKQQIQRPTFMFMLENAPLEFDYDSLDGFFRSLYEVYKQKIGSKSKLKYLRTKEDMRDQFINSILLILSGEREIDRMLTPYGVIPNIEDESGITIKNEKKYDVKEEEGGRARDNLTQIKNSLTQIKHNFEKGDHEDIDEDEDEDEDEIIDEVEVEDDAPVFIKKYADDNIERQEPINPFGIFKRIYTDFWGRSKNSY